MRIKMKAVFLNPVTNRMEKIDHEMNVPRNRFWFKRVDQHDCVEIKLKSTAKSLPKDEKANAYKPKKGSK